MATTATAVASVRLVLDEAEDEDLLDGSDGCWGCSLQRVPEKMAS